MALTRMIMIPLLSLALGGPVLAGKTPAPLAAKTSAPAPAKKEPKTCGTGKAPCPCSIC